MAVYWSIKRYAAPIVRRLGLSPGSGGFLPALLIGALLLCHGVMGFAHQTSCHECHATDLLLSVPPAYEHAMGDAGGHGGDDPTSGHVFTGYFAVFLALFGAAALKLLLGGARRPARVALLRTSRPRYSTVVSSLPRGPTPPLLQVFRL